MNLPTEQIRHLCTSEIFDRAVNYREEGRLDRIDRFDETLSAAVQGSQPSPYEVDIDFESGRIDAEHIDAPCTCPYDWGGYCKHIIAVLLEVRRAMSTSKTSARPSNASCRKLTPRKSATSCSKSVSATPICDADC